eukprot:12685277-Ditylum_brightwellii.AAC.1
MQYSPKQDHSDVPGMKSFTPNKKPGARIRQSVDREQAMSAQICNKDFRKRASVSYNIYCFK